MGNALRKELDDIRRQAEIKNYVKADNTVWGIVTIEGDLKKCLKKVDGVWQEVDEPPQVYVAEKLEKAVTSDKRFIVIIGGRGSGKSVLAGDKVNVGMHDEGENWYCLREFHESIDASVYSLLISEQERLELDGFTHTNTKIHHHGGAHANFAGIARNPDSIKSAFGYKGFWIEEADRISANSLKILTPTARRKPEKGLPRKMEEVESDEVDLTKIQMLFTGNPGSREDPFSQRFIVPFLDALDKDGIYEDELHLVIKMNWYDNPWYHLSGLDEERLFDKKHKSTEEYEHIWEGAFNDHIENALVMPDWFDACIDAHEKLGFKARGVKKVIHDPSDLGADPKALAYRHGNVFIEVEERDDLDVNEGSDWATGYAVEVGADQYEWDVGGLGAPLKRDVNRDLEGTKIDVYQFNGQSGVDNPDGIYEPSGASNIQQEKQNKETCKNLRAQCYMLLRDRIYKTYRAVVHEEICDPEELISFSSDIKHLNKLRSELCRMPIKPNGSGLFELYTKKDMREKFKLPSPNLADVVMMSERKHIRKKRPTGAYNPAGAKVRRHVR